LKTYFHAIVEKASTSDSQFERHVVPEVIVRTRVLRAFSPDCATTCHSNLESKVLPFSTYVSTYSSK
jgi:hypothetical protein